MKVIYYYIVYLKTKRKSTDVPEIHACPFTTREKAEKYKEEQDKVFGDRLAHSKIKKVDISKSEGGFWL